MKASFGILGLVAFAGVAGADTIYWSTNPPDTQWGNPANWVGGRVPGVNDLAVITPGAGPLVQGFVRIAGLYIQPGANMTVVSQLYVIGGASIQGRMSIAGQPAIFLHRDDVNLEGQIVMWGGASIERYFSGGGTFTVRPGGSIQVPAYDTVGVTIGTGLLVEGTIDVQSTHPVSVGAYTREHNDVSYVGINPGGVLRFSQSGSIVSTFAGWQQPPYIANGGVIEVTGAASDVVDISSTIGLLNAGIMDVDRPDVRVHHSMDIALDGTLRRGLWACRNYGRVIFEEAITSIGPDVAVRLSQGGSALLSAAHLRSNYGQLYADLGAAFNAGGGSDFENHGLIDLDTNAAFRVSGAFRNAPEGVVSTWIGGTQPGEHGTVEADSATLGGTLNARVTAWYAPAKGDTIPTVLASPLNGTFAQVNTLYSGEVFRPVYSPTAMSLVVGCPADFNGDGFLDFFDYDDFIACFEGAGCPAGRTADFNGDSFADFFDYDDFVAAFEAGC